MIGQEVLFSSKDKLCLTPSWIIEGVKKIGPLGLDPATEFDNPTGARIFYTEEDNGLKKPWVDVLQPGETCFLNHPYGVKENKEWSAKFLKETINNIQEDLSIKSHFTWLCASRTDTKWFQQPAEFADKILFIKGRLKFYIRTLSERESLKNMIANPNDPNLKLIDNTIEKKGVLSGAPFPSCLMYFGPDVKKFEKVFKGRGIFL